MKNKNKNIESAKELSIDVKASNTDVVKYTWLTYVIFFIPYLFSYKNNFVLVHLNNSLKLFIIDIIGAMCVSVSLLFDKVSSIVWGVMLLSIMIFGLIVLFASLLSRIYLIYMCIKGKTVELPIFNKK